MEFPLRAFRNIVLTVKTKVIMLAVRAESHSGHLENFAKACKTIISTPHVLKLNGAGFSMKTATVRLGAARPLRPRLQIGLALSYPEIDT
jgi:hypothetical protein